MREAFSLVELSIVLVILGLLTGGILAGQNLIRATELRSVSTEYNTYRTTIYTFRDKYFALPGDMINASDFWDYPSSNSANCPATAGSGTETCNGSGDGLIDNAGSADEYGESLMSWQHLANAGLLEGAYTGMAGPAGPKDDIPGENVPRSKMGGGAWWFDHRAGDNGSTERFDVDYGNVFSFGRENGTSNLIPREDILIPEEAWNLDTKLDDGLPAQGNIIVFGVTTCTTATVNTELDVSYALDETNKTCGLMIKLR